MKSRVKTLIEKSIAAMRAAVEIVNRPKYGYREEIFVLLCINAWELLIKAKYLKDHKGTITCLFVEDENRKKKNGKPASKPTRSGNPRTHELMYLIGQMNAGQEQVERNVIENIKLLIEARDNATHFFNHTAQIDKLIREVGLASVKNYVELMEEWFSISLDEFGFCLIPVSAVEIPKSVQSMIGNKAEQKFVKFLMDMITSQDTNTSKSISIMLDVKMNRTSKPQQCLNFQVVPDSDNKITISEEDRLKQFPFSYSELIDKMKARYTDFIRNTEFNKKMREIQDDSSCCYTRFLDPRRKKTPKRFYNANVMNKYFDSIYTKK